MNAVDILGYVGLSVSLGAMAVRTMLPLRLLSLTANLIYIVYGIILDAFPIAIGCSIAVSLHVYHIILLVRNSPPATSS